jgi:hypothetical protein
VCLNVEPRRKDHEAMESIRNPKQNKQPLQVAPLIVGPANATAVTGFNWRWVRDFWASRGRRFVGAGKKRGIPAAALLDELARTEAEPALPSIARTEPEHVDAAEAVRQAIGVSRRRA